MLLTSVSSGGYLVVLVVGVAQSACIPAASELTLGLAGALAATGRLDLAGVIVVSGVGETIGAYLAWAVGRTRGRRWVTRHGDYVLLTRTDLDRCELWYLRHEVSGVVAGRLLPVLRSFAALSAGLGDVPAVSFGVLTLAGSLIWDGAMAGIGYGAGSDWHRAVHPFVAAGDVLAVVALVVITLAVTNRLYASRGLRALERWAALVGYGPPRDPARPPPAGRGPAGRGPAGRGPAGQGPAGRGPAGRGPRRPPRWGPKHRIR